MKKGIFLLFILIACALVLASCTQSAGYMRKLQQVDSLMENKRCALFQFFKAGAESGEVKMLGEVGVKVFKAPCVCWWHEPSTSDLMERIKPYLEEVKHALLSGDYDLVVLDEGTYLLRPELWGDEALIKLLEARAPKTSVVITGREAPLSLCQIADTVTNMQAQKHAFEAGIAAQKGIEW